MNDRLGSDAPTEPGKTGQVIKIGADGKPHWFHLTDGAIVTTKISNSAITTSMLIANSAVSPDRTPLEAELARSLRAIVRRCEERMQALCEQGQSESTEADVLEQIVLIVVRTPAVYPV